MTRSDGAKIVAAWIALLLVGHGESRGASEVTLGRNWAANQHVSLDAIDHGVWDALLRQYVDSEGYVDYSKWKASSQAMQALDQYLESLSQAGPQLPAERNATLAFWINAYNAVTIKGMLKEYPTDSIRNHTPKFFGYNIWDDLKLVVGGKRVSLNQMEHDILRKMGEPRIHFAVVCASVGCPKLLNAAYVPDKLEEQLTANSKSFFADRSKFNYDAPSGRIQLSPILKWYGNDFGSTIEQRLVAISAYLPDEQAVRLARSGAAKIGYLDYDWGINDQKKRRP